jgi:hypothetical protein
MFGPPEALPSGSSARLVWLPLAPYRQRHRSSVGEATRRTNDATEHAGEDQLVDRAEQVTIREPYISTGVKHGCSATLGGTVSIGVGLELQPQTPGYFDLGREEREAVWCEALHPPEVDYITDGQVDRIASATSQAYATPEECPRAHGPPRTNRGRTSPFRPPIRLIGSNACSDERPTPITRVETRRRPKLILLHPSGVCGQTPWPHR